MNVQHLRDKFNLMGARVKFIDARVPAIRVNILSDGRGDFFEVCKPKDVEVTVSQVLPKDRHLLLLSKTLMPSGKIEIDRFLCGHDERAWFVAAVPGKVSTVVGAKDSLRPKQVNESLRSSGVSSHKRHKRHNKGYIRQGEWFFIPEPKLVVSPHVILQNEPIRRGRGKPHVVQEVYRTGGTTVYVNTANPNGITQVQYNAQPNKNGWRIMVRDAQVYARGTVRHSDHATITLHGWHSVVLNTESSSRSMRHVAFLD